MEVETNGIGPRNGVQESLCEVRLDYARDSPVVWRCVQFHHCGRCREHGTCLGQVAIPKNWQPGFVDVGECVEKAAIREAKEETCLDVELVTMLGLYSNPKRDPRGHTVTAIYVAQSTGTPVAADDAQSVGVFSLDQLPSPLAFDHQMVLEDYRRYRETGEVAPLRLV